MTGLVASVRVLFGKNWRIKQRESVLNRRRSTTPGAWLFPPLITDVILPLAVLLYIVMGFCRLNITTVSMTENVFDMATRRLMPQAPAVGRFPVSLTFPTTSAAVPMMTALPLLLQTLNLTLVTLDRPDNKAFFAHLDREYSGDETLGLVPISSLTKVLPVPADISVSAADELLIEYPKASGSGVFAGIDVRRASPLAPYEARVFLNEDDNQAAAKAQLTDQIYKYFTVDIDAPAEDGRTLHIPGPLVLQMEMTLFLRRGGKSASRATASATNVSPTEACRLVDTMLDATGLSWQDFPSTSQLGGGEASCEKAIKAGRVGAKTLAFLAHFVEMDNSLDTLRNLNVNVLPHRPRNGVVGQLDGNIVFFMVYLFIWPFNRLVRDVIIEKEKQLKEYLLIMGLQPMALLVSWFLLYLVGSVVSVLLAVYMLNGEMFAATQASQVHFFLLLMVFATSMLLFGLAITPMFSTARTAAMASPLIYLVLSAAPLLQSYLGDEAVQHSALRYVIWFMHQFSSPVVFMEALHHVTPLDPVTIKVRPIAWETVAVPILKIAIQCVGYLVLGWYLENVFPRAFGVQQRWYFLLQPSYWFPDRFGQSAGNGADDEDELVQLTAGDESGEAGFPDDDTMREMSMSDYMHHFHPILLVKGLSKRYPNGKLAVNNVSFGVKKGEIFGLLGPNGAGKSTTMSIICGMLCPTTGDAHVGSRSVAQDPLAIRKSLSVCFQANILFDDLTVWEHLKLVYDLKTSLGIKAVDEEMWVHKLKHFGLEEKRDALSKTLSGGQKRKLSLILALMDTSRVILLDEPTAGMDLKARVDTWDALRKAVNHRAVILTTHSMQEAQALCENIGIVAEGKLKCCGSSLFLREKFGVGYKLTVVHVEDAKDTTHEMTTDKIMATVKKVVPGAVLVSSNKWETRVQLNSDEPAAMIPVFEELEQMKREQLIKRYAVAATDLEDVFVRVTEGGDVYYHVKDTDENELAKAKSPGKRMESVSSFQSVATRHTDLQAIPLQLRALLLKRWKLMIRDKRAFLAHYVWPLVFYVILLAIATSTFDSSLETLTALPTTASHSSLFVGTLPGATSASKKIFEHLDVSIQSRVKWQEVATPDQIIDFVMHNDTSTSYFGAVLIRNTTFESLDTSMLRFSIYYNETIQHSMPVALEWLSSGYCKALNDKTGASAATNCDLSFTKSAFPSRKIISIKSDENDVSFGGSPNQSQDVAQLFLVATYVLITLSSITANYITAIVKEKELGLKRLQYLHLASERASTVYWLSHLVYDYIGYLLSIVVIVVITAMYHVTWPTDVMATLVAQTLVFGLSMLAFSYVLSLAFSSHSSAQSVMSFAATFQVIAAFVVFALSLIPSLCAKTSTAAMFLRVLPLFAYSEAMINLVTVEMAPLRSQCVAASSGKSMASNGFNFPLDLSTPSPWDWSVGGRSLTYMIVSFFVYFTILLAVDAMQSYPTILQNRLNWLLRRQNVPYGRVTHDIESPSRDVIEVHHLTKVYNPKKKSQSNENDQHQDPGASSDHEDQPVVNQDGQVVAVDDVSFVVERNDCVALLGVNGSGKSTTFEVLTSGIAPTSGNALINGIDVTLNPQLASRQYGYCPQTNVQFPEMSVREHLQLAYRLRTRQHYSLRQEEAALDNLMTKLDLHQVENTAAGHLSGGNKRRLMLALSLLTDEVSILLMDEPSAGVDVVARRLMWKVLYEKRQGNRDVSCLFTTHSMEEAEAVCANAVVLNKGKLVWNGSIPELKQHAAAGISITVRLDTNSIWEQERVRYYVDKIRAVVARSSSASFGVDLNKVPATDLLNAWRACRDHNPRTKGQPATNVEHQWISALISRVMNEHTSTNASPNPHGTDVAATPASMDTTEFVKEWLLREAFAAIETQVFQAEISARSGEPVKPVTLYDASGSGTSSSAVYETNCNAHFALVDAFTTLEAHKTAFSIARYSISELSLERVFDQFT